jgi:hypothetical protein
MAIREGRQPAGERADPALGPALDRIDEVLERQLHLLDWFFGRFERCLPPERVVRYEQMITTGGRSLAPIAGREAAGGVALESRNSAGAYGGELLERLAPALLSSGGAWRRFYGDADIRSLLGG